MKRMICMSHLVGTFSRGSFSRCMGWFLGFRFVYRHLLLLTARNGRDVACRIG